jgi:hypothetical protein
LRGDTVWIEEAISYIDAAILPSVRFSIGGFPVTLNNADVLLKPTNEKSNFFAGNLGIDLLHVLLEEIAEAALDGKRKEHMELLTTVPLLIIDDLGMRKLGPTAAEELLEIVMRRYERTISLNLSYEHLVPD